MPDVEKIVKVKMTQNGYDHNVGKMREGGVYEFPQEQAVRYVRAGVAKPAPASAKLARDEDRAKRVEVLKDREEHEVLDQEMSAAWDIDVRDLERAEWDLEAAEKAAESATDAVKRAQDARKRTVKTDSPEPGPVHTQGPIVG
jgi:hypothetical protein